LITTISGLLLTSIYLHRLPAYSKTDIEILYILFVLFVVTMGLQKHGVISAIADKLDHGRFIAGKLVTITFFLSMFITNDVALISIVPLTMLLHIKHKEWLIILETLAANAGSALSPFGNPQNLFIYWFYNISFSDFLKTIAPFTALFFFLFLIGSFIIDSKNSPTFYNIQDTLSTSAYVYIGMLLLFILSLLRILPLFIGWGIIFYVLVFDIESLKIDYILLVTFWCFFGFTDNLHILLAGVLSHSHHIFILAVLFSQLISNVPTALLLADFTTHWQALLWGVSVGGFGSLIASLSNLIAYRIYVRQEKQRALQFAVKFHILSYLTFIVGVFLYFMIYNTN